LNGINDDFDAEQIVAQELLAIDDNLSAKRIFWKRDKHGSEAEVDFLYKYNAWAIPVEVKSGHNSKLKSLHLFMDEVSTPNGKYFTLINIPFYYVGVIDKVLDNIIKGISFR
jgi:predicted AAA+ superfamily ATPase